MPTTDTPWTDGTPCWVDYSAADIDAARAFYSDVFGWTYLGGDPEFGGYDNALIGDRPVAGLGPQMDEGDAPRWTTYFATSDAAETASRISQAGGTIVVPPMQVGPMGTMVVAVGPQGEPFGLWQAGEHIGARVYNEPGAVVWNEAALEDPDAARAFYTAVFGFTFDEVPDAGGYTTFRTADRPLGGLGAREPGAPAGWTTCFAVASADDTVAAIEASGGKVLTPAQDTPFGRFAVVEDPWGAPFTVMQEPAS
ncbi:MAG TPA: VOC family protein [Mycobacteriales bacterium]|jgi:hypothetical protein|nr:VOC family protein [Mycobacteriales bacterium]